MELRALSGDHPACRKWRSFSVQNVAMDWRVRSGEQVAGGLRHWISVSEVAMEMRALSGEHLACRKWRYIGVSEAAMNVACSEWR